MPDRRTLAPSNTAGAISGASLMEDINDEVANLWRRAAVRLSSVAGTNVITAACDVPIPSNQSGNQFWFFPAAPNTGNVTLDVDGRGALPVRDASGNELPAGYLSASRLETVINMGSEYRLTMPNLNAAAGTAALRATIAYQQPNGTHGGTGTSGSRVRYPFNTVISNTIPSLTLDSVTNVGRLSLPARKYDRIEARCQFYEMNCGLHLRNISDAADIADAARVQMAGYGPAQLVAGFTLAASKNFEFQYYSSSGRATVGLGLALTDSGGAPERYGFLEITSSG